MGQLLIASMVSVNAIDARCYDLPGHLLHLATLITAKAGVTWVAVSANL